MGTRREEVKGWLWLWQGEIEGKCLPGRQRTAWIDDVRRWTEGGLLDAQGIKLDGLRRMRAEKQNKKVRSLWPYKGMT